MLNFKKARVWLIVFLFIMMISPVIGLITNLQEKEIDDALETNQVDIKQTGDENISTIEPTTVPERTLEQETEPEIKESEITLGDLQNMSIISKDDFFEETYPLVAKIDDQEIYLYGQPNGAVLRVNDHIQLFDWILTTPRFILPRLFTEDMDKDGTEEIICLLNVGSGTGVAIDELHILKQAETDDYEDVVFDDCVDQLVQFVSFEYVQGAEDFTVRINDTFKQFALLEDDEEYTIEGLSLNSCVIMYEYDEGVTIEIPIGIRTEECAFLLYTGINVKADVEFDHNDFHLSNIRIVEEDY